MTDHDAPSAADSDPHALNEPDDSRAPDPLAGVVERGTEPAAEGRDETDREARASMPPGADTRPGPKSDVDRAQPYDEQPIGLRMEEEPLEEP